MRTVICSVRGASGKVLWRGWTGSAADRPPIIKQENSTQPAEEQWEWLADFPCRTPRTPILSMYATKLKRIESHRGAPNLTLFSRMAQRLDLWSGLLMEVERHFEQAIAGALLNGRSW